MSLIWLLLLAVMGLSPAFAQGWNPRDVEIRVIDDRGRPFREIYAADLSRGNDYRAYIEALPRQRYQIEVRNHSRERIGLVIAVDGRNIISGEASNLTPRERMYVLEPGGRGRYEGWRTAQNRVNRFIFTQADSSYAAAWGDESAMGVIAVAVYPEQRARPQPPLAGMPSLRSAPAAPGTGFGESVDSPSRQVEFRPEQRVALRYFYKYEWRETLCDRGLLDCGRRPRQENRFWPEDSGFAPPPPRR